MIETFSANTSYYSFRIRILERRMGRSARFLHLHPFHPASKLRSVDRISIPEQISRRGVIGKCLDHLLRRPDGRRMRSDIEVDNPSSIMEQDDKTVQGTK